MKTKAELETLLTESNQLATKTAEVVAQVKDLQVQSAKAQEQATANSLAVQAYRSPVGLQSGSDEQRALRFFGCSHPKQLLDINTCDPRFKGIPAEFGMIVRNFKSEVDTARYISQMFRGDPKDTMKADGDANLARCKQILDTPFGKELGLRLKAFGSTTSGSGADWVPTAVSSQFVQEFELEHSLDQKFRNINMPTNPYKLSTQTSVTKARGIAESATATGNSFGTGSITFSAQKLFEYYPLSDELTEDSAVDILPVARDEVTRAQIRARESGFLNGSKASTHIDADTAAAPANVCEKLFNGLRQLALSNSANGGTYSFGASQVAEPLLREMRGKGKKFFTNPKGLMWICGVQVYQQLVGLTNVATVEKFGPMATVLQGALAAYQGIPIYTNEFMREDLNASGVYDGTTTTYGGLILVNKDRFYVGNRRPIRVRVMEDLPYNDQWLLASYSRVDFEGMPQNAAETSVVYGIDIAL